MGAPGTCDTAPETYSENTSNEDLTREEDLQHQAHIAALQGKFEEPDRELATTLSGQLPEITTVWSRLIEELQRDGETLYQLRTNNPPALPGDC